MTPERYEQIGRICDAALELARVERAAFIARACGGGEELRPEVEPLVETREQAGDFKEFTDDLERVRRFELEARAASALNHPDILTIHEIVRAEGLYYLATEYTEGEALRGATPKKGGLRWTTHQSRFSAQRRFSSSRPAPWGNSHRAGRRSVPRARLWLARPPRAMSAR